MKAERFPPARASDRHLGEHTLATVSRELPRLPSAIRYEDDYSGVLRAIRDLNESLVWRLKIDGKNLKVDWSDFPEEVVFFSKHWLCWMLRALDASSVGGYLYLLRHLSANLPETITTFLREPGKVRSFWATTIVPSSKNFQTLAFYKRLIFFMCDSGLGHWTPDHIQYVKSWSYGNLSRRDTMAAVRTGDAFLSVDEEIKLVAHFDFLADTLSVGTEKIGAETLREACVLYWSYQHAFRPIQIASLDLSDIRVRTFSNEPPVVHTTFTAAKQRRGQPRQRMVRAMKREWAWLMARYVEMRKERPECFLTDPDRQQSLFGLSPQGVSTTISEATFRISGRRSSPTRLRHTAAQRLVDAGASELELAEFLGHKSINTGLVYFDASPSQADRINKALGLSPVYREVEQVARTGVIDIEKLVGMEPDQQIGAVPHGIPVAGIGGCDIGQSACSKNPALSCYTCSKFLPLSDPDVHDEVAKEFRSVVDQFVSAGRGDPTNPAFMQLRRTLEALELLVHELRGEIS